MGKFTGNPYIWWQKAWFPVDFPLNQSIDPISIDGPPKSHGGPRLPRLGRLPWNCTSAGGLRERLMASWWFSFCSATGRFWSSQRQFGIEGIEGMGLWKLWNWCHEALWKGLQWIHRSTTISAAPKCPTSHRSLILAVQEEALLKNRRQNLGWETGGKQFWYVLICFDVWMIDFIWFSSWSHPKWLDTSSILRAEAQFS